MAYATIADMRKVADVATSDEPRAEALLERASNILDVEFERAHVDVDSKSEAWTSYLVDVVVDMAIKGMNDNFGGMDATQMTMTAGSYSQSWSNADGISAMEPTIKQRERLGIQRRRTRIGFAAIGGGDD